MGKDWKNDLSSMFWGLLILLSVVPSTGFALTISDNRVDMESEGESSEIELRVSSSGVAGTPLLHGTKTGGTLANPTYTPNNSTLLSVGGQGHDGSALTNGSSANIRFRSTEDWSSAGHGSEIRFSTTQNGSMVRTDRMWITNDGKIGIGTPSPTQALDVAGSINALSFTGNGSGLSNVTAADLSCTGCVSPGQLNFTPGTITSVSPGAGLSGGGASGNVSLDVSFDGTGSASTVARSDHDHGLVYQQKYGKMAVVALSSGDYADPVTAMADLGTWCGVPSETNPCLLKIMPGVYDIGTNSLIMQSFVDLEGSGEFVTKITGSVVSPDLATPLGTLKCAPNMETRFITVENTGAGGIRIALLSNILVPAERCYLSHITVLASGGDTNIGVANIQGFVQTSEVSITASGGTTSYGVYNKNTPRPILSFVTIRAEGATAVNAAIYNESGNPTIRWARLFVTPVSTAQNYGIYNDTGSVVMRDAFMSMTGSGCAAGCYGVYTLSSVPNRTTVIDQSEISGSTNTIVNGANVIMNVGLSKLAGGPVSNSGTLKCVGSYNSTYDPLSPSCTFP